MKRALALVMLAALTSAALGAELTPGQRKVLDHIGDVLAAGDACHAIPDYRQIERFAAMAAIDANKEPALGLIFERKHAAAAAWSSLPIVGPHCSRARTLYGPRGSVFPNLLPDR